MTRLVACLIVVVAGLMMLHGHFSFPLAVRKPHVSSAWVRFDYEGYQVTIVVPYRCHSWQFSCGVHTG